MGAGGPSGTTISPHQATAKRPVQKPQREMFNSSTLHQNPGERQGAPSLAATAPTTLLTQRDHELFWSAQPELPTPHPIPTPKSQAPWVWEDSRGKFQPPPPSFTWIGAGPLGPTSTLPSVEPPTSLSRGWKRKEAPAEVPRTRYIHHLAGGREGGWKGEEPPVPQCGPGGGGAPAGPRGWVGGYGG